MKGYKPKVRGNLPKKRKKVSLREIRNDVIEAVGLIETDKPMVSTKMKLEKRKEIQKLRTEARKKYKEEVKTRRKQ